MSVSITPEIIDEMVRRIVEQFEPVAVVLFGSCARGEVTRDSDVDLMVVMPDGTDQHEAAVAILGALSGTGAPKDVLVATPAILKRFGNTPGLIWRAILRDGKTVYERGR